MNNYFITLSDGEKEFPIFGLKANEQVDLTDCECSNITHENLIQLERLTRFPQLKGNASLLIEIIKKRI